MEQEDSSRAIIEMTNAPHSTRRIFGRIFPSTFSTPYFDAEKRKALPCSEGLNVNVSRCSMKPCVDFIKMRRAVIVKL